jgi:hypothetical protein
MHWPSIIPAQYRHDKLCNVARVILCYSKAEPAVRSLASLPRGSWDWLTITLW